MPPLKKPQTVLVERMRESALLAARRVVADAVLQKLREQNVCTDDLPIDELVDRVLDGQDGVFPWTRGDDPDITIEFTEQDAKELSSRIPNPVHDSEFFQKCLDSAVKSFLRSLENEWSERKTYEEAELYGFRRRLEQTWGGPLKDLRMMLATSQDSFLREAESLRRSKAKRKELREALLGIHARALRTTTAIIILLENGLADDAYARWRTLYELSIISAFISEHGQDAAGVRLFCVGGPEGSRRGCERHGKSYLTRRRRGEEGDGGGSLTGGAIPSA